MAPSATSAQPKSQYHHFIPRFILRNFSHPFKPPNPPKGSAKRSKRKQKHSYYAGEPMLHGISLASATAEIIETPVSKTFGLTDMYRDFAHDFNQHHIEEQLSRLESRAGEIVSNIRKAFEARQPDVWLTRADRDTLRKFLFIMKYRGSNFRRRFYHEHAEGYTSDDKETLMRYMREKGFQKPIDVWFDNIKAMLELKMDNSLKWMDVLRKRAYPADAEWFIINTQSFYLALCTPNYQDDEFLLTENAYSMHEGPVSLQADPDTGELTMKCYTEYHVFAPISAKLTIVLRSFLLPSPLEDTDEETREFRQTMLDMTTIQHNFPDKATSSFLKDLPIAKARNSYSTLVDGRMVLLDGETNTPQTRDKFCFCFFPISTDHVHRINAIMLQEAYETSVIAFKTACGARRALEFYLGMSCERGFKTISDAADDPRLAYLKMLQQAAQQLGSTSVAVYERQKLKEMDEEGMYETLGRMFERAIPKEPNDFMALYAKLSGSRTTLPKDMDQASRMLNMRIKADVWTQGVAENIREEIREHVRDLFCQRTLPRRVWLYLKQIRHMKLAGITLESTATGEGKGEGRGKVTNSKYGDPAMDGPEDVIANVTQVFRDGNALCHAMYQATLNDILLTKNPDYGIVKELTLDAEGMSRFQEEKELVFGPLGSICDCGIPRVEGQANFYKDLLLTTQLHKKSASPLLTDEQNVEVAVRLVVRDSFNDILGGVVVSPTELKALEEALFEVVYPSFGGRCG